MYCRSFCCLAVFWCTLGWAAGSSPPPPLPSAGIIERELEKEYESKPLEPDKEAPRLQIDIPKKQLEMPKGQKVYVKEVIIEGNEAISSKEILSWISEKLDCDLTIEGIRGLCRIIDQGYAKKGYFLTRAYPPVQTMQNGVLRIAILEGKLGCVEVEGNRFYSTRFIQSYFTRYCGKSLRYDDFMRALLLLNENTDLIAGGIFQKGAKAGEADLLIRVQDVRPIHMYLNSNNYGRYLTTNYRLGERFDWNNMIVQGDLFSLAEVIGFPLNALYFTDVKYKIPLTSNGAFLEFGFLFSKFHVEELKSLQQKGNSLIGTIKGSYALTRTRHLSVDLFSYFDIKQFQQFTQNQLTSYDKLRVLTAAFLIDHFGRWRGRDYLLVRTAVGIPSFLGGMPVHSSLSSRLGAGGRFIKFSVDYDRLQYLGKSCLLKFHATGQWSPNLLTVPEQIYIGGSDSVRGFPLAVSTGDRGYYCNLEFHVPPPILANRSFFMAKKKWREVLQLVGFIDQGGTFFQSFENVFLWGAGFGIRYQGPFRLGLALDVGYPLNRKDLSPGSFMYLKVTGQPF